MITRRAPGCVVGDRLFGWAVGRLIRRSVDAGWHVRRVVLGWLVHCCSDFVNESIILFETDAENPSHVSCFCFDLSIGEKSNHAPLISRL